MYIADGYPKNILNKTGVIRLLLFAKSNPDNKFCSKKSLVSYLLPREIFNFAVDAAKEDIDKALKQCCRTKLDGIDIMKNRLHLKSKASKSNFSISPKNILSALIILLNRIY